MDIKDWWSYIFYFNPNFVMALLYGWLDTIKDLLLSMLSKQHLKKILCT